MRTFGTGATRSGEAGKPDYDGYLSPLVIRRYGEFMRKHQVQEDGVVRASDNWKRGMPLESFMKSGWRHFMAWWLLHHGEMADDDLDDTLCALLFNVSGYLHERLRAKEDV